LNAREKTLGAAEKLEDFKTQSLIGNMVLDGFPKKIRNKTFYFHTKKIISFILFLLSLGPRVHFLVKPP
jgi:hypothetical protein